MKRTGTSRSSILRAAASARQVRRCTRQIAIILRRDSAWRGYPEAPMGRQPSAQDLACTTARTRTMTSVTGRRALTQFGQFQIKSNDSSCTCTAFMGSLQRSFTSGWLWQTQYMWSHAITDGSGGTGETVQVQNASCPACDRSDATFDVRHSLTMNSVYQLPIGPGRNHWNAKGVAGDLLGGWQVSGILTARSGLPVNITVTR